MRIWVNSTMSPSRRPFCITAVLTKTVLACCWTSLSACAPSFCIAAVRSASVSRGSPARAGFAARRARSALIKASCSGPVLVSGGTRGCGSRKYKMTGVTAIANSAMHVARKNGRPQPGAHCSTTVANCDTLETSPNATYRTTNRAISPAIRTIILCTSITPAQPTRCKPACATDRRRTAPPAAPNRDRNRSEAV